MKTLGHSVCLFLALCLLTVGLSSPLAGAELKSLLVPGMSFHPKDSKITYSNFGVDGLNGIYATSNPNPNFGFTAPVNLPDGTFVSTVRMFFMDFNASFNCTGAYTIQDFSNHSFSCSFTSSGSPGSVYADIFVNNTIDHSKFAYTLNWSSQASDSSIVLIGFQIFYTPPPGRAAVIPLF